MKSVHIWPVRRSIWRLSLEWILVCALLVCTCAEVSAQARNGNVVLLYDSSGSMGAETTRGERKVVVARAAVRHLLDGLQQENAGNLVGIVAFGHTYPSKLEFRDRSCRDIEILRPRAAIDGQAADDLTQTVNRLEPRGYTPISEAIRKADAVLGPEGGTIVLVTDFEDTCESSPNAACEALLAINMPRLANNRVYIDSIVVPKAPNMDTGPVTELKNCSGAYYLELFSAADSRTRMPEIAKRLTQYARAARPAETLNKPTLRVVTLAAGQNSQMVERYSTMIRHSNSTRNLLDRPVAVPSSPVTLEAGVYDVVLLDGEQTVAERAAVALKAGDQATVYFTP